MVVIQTAVCVCLFGGGETVPFIPSYYAYYTDWLSSFCSGNQTVAPFQSTTLLLLLFALYPSDTSLSLINQPPPPLLSRLSPCALHSSPEVMGEGESEGETERETGQACTVDNIVYARRKVACNFCSRGDIHKGSRGGG